MLEAVDDRVEHLLGQRVQVVQDVLHLVLGQAEIAEQFQITDRPDLVELVVGRRVLAEPGHRLLGERELDGGGEVGQQQRDAPPVLARDDEELVLDAGDDERAALRRLRAQSRQQHPEVVEHRRRQRLDPPLRAVAERRHGKSPLCHCCTTSLEDRATPLARTPV